MLSSLFIIPGCRSKKISQSIYPGFSLQNNDEQPEIDLRLLDIPLPVDVNVIAKESDYSGIPIAGLLTCKTMISIDGLVLFYKKEMERAGWQEVVNCSFNPETVMYYEMPRRWALISLRHTVKNELSPTLFVIAFGTR